jgi:hypothetical protein
MSSFRLLARIIAKAFCFQVATIEMVSAASVNEAGSITVRLTQAHDAKLDEMVTLPAWAKTARSSDRAAAVQVLVLATGHANGASRWHRSPDLLATMTVAAEYLQAVRPESDLYDSGNHDSPPDSSFMIAALTKALVLLENDGDERSRPLRDLLEKIIRPTAAAIARGGVHTPNHRWDVCAMLASVHHRFPTDELRTRIDEWLAEGMDQDADGNYSERSPAYSGKVVNPAFIELAEALDRPELLAAVRRNLALTARLVNPDGTVVALASRRQDQHATARVGISDFYWTARYLAVRANDRLAAGLARWIEEDFFDQLLANPRDPNWPLPWLLMRPELAGPLPEGEVPTKYTTTFEATGLARVRDGERVATINGGNDWAAGFGHGSGLATNPTFFAFEKGRAALASVRMTPDFFGTGYFYPEGIETIDGGWRLRQRVAVPYYQPLAPHLRRADGDYPLTPDGRFFSKMAFDQRPRDERVLETQVTVKPVGEGFELDLEVDGLTGVSVTVELAFRGDGTLVGVERAERDPQGDQPSQACLLGEGWGSFRVGDDVIEFGPGVNEGPPERMWDGHIAWTGGRIVAVGQRVYLTGVTPFRHRLTFR